ATDCAPLLRFNRTLLPIRHVGEPLGWELKWDGERKMATVIKGNRQVRVWVDHPAARVSTDGGKTWEAAAIDPADSRVVPVIVNGRTLLPLRFVAEALNTGVHWDGATKTVTVTQ
ncbi:MAG: copper amine oxidase N-terminal domain-containing protein, partial [Candidatus Desulforudis sp.]|nr:copper amine oxidase N-terminal domain-containing protein [Desulforudis sp.]